MNNVEVEVKLTQAAQHLKYAQKQFDDRLLIAATDEELALMTQISSAASLLAIAGFLQVIACQVAEPMTFSNKMDFPTEAKEWKPFPMPAKDNTK